MTEVPAGVWRTLSTYAWGLDQDELDLTISCFADHAVALIFVSGADDTRGPFVGKDAIRAMYMPSRAARQPGEQRRHFFTNIELEHTGRGQCTVRGYVLVTRATQGQMSLLTGGWLRFTMIEGDGGWLISRAEEHLDQPFFGLVR